MATSDVPWPAENLKVAQVVEALILLGTRAHKEEAQDSPVVPSTELPCGSHAARDRCHYISVSSRGPPAATRGRKASATPAGRVRACQAFRRRTQNKGRSLSARVPCRSSQSKADLKASLVL